MSDDDVANELITLSSDSSKETYNVEDAISNIGFGVFSILIIMVAGLSWTADSMELMLLSFTSSYLSCEWNLTNMQGVVINTTVFFGNFIGAFMWGVFSDKRGRRFTLITSSILMAVSSVMSIFAPNYWFFLGSRFLVGFGIAGAHCNISLMIEFTPSKHRGKVAIIVALFWALGSVLLALIAWGVLPNMSWRYLFAIAAIPVFIILLISFFTPESPRYDITAGNHESAVKTLNTVASINRGRLPKGELIRNTRENKGSFMDLFSVTLRRTTITTAYLWFCCSLLYYGAVLIVTEMFRAEDLGLRCNFSGNVSSVENSTSTDSTCFALQSSDFITVLVTSFAEIPGVLVTALVVDRMGRKKLMIFQFLISAGFLLLLAFCFPRWLETIIQFIIRGTLMGVFQVMYLYTPEVFPTTLRTSATGFCSSISRIGGMIAPIIVQTLYGTSLGFTLPILILCFIAFSGAIATYTLPFETKGQVMKDTIDDFAEKF